MQHPFEHFLQQIVFGLQAGSTYALIALGYTMVYGVLRLINFAHGDVYMVGMYITVLSVRAIYLHHWISPSWEMLCIVLLLSMIGCGLLGVIIERLAYRPLRKAPRLAALITAIGVSLLLENTGNLDSVFGSSPLTCKDVLPGGHTDFNIGGVLIERNYLVIFVATIVLLAILWFVVSKTRLGRAMRAVSQDVDAASLMGVNTNKVISFTFFVGSALAGAAGCLFASMTPNSINPYIGILPGVKAFVAAVLGGIGNIPGAAVGGFLMGLAESLVVAYGPLIHLGNGYNDAAAFAILILILLFRPTGLFGRGITEKV
ncbi:MAG: branched-chain amino acid ABC transporter permease [Capsulimonadaceae bacterium]|nr:branched-chain amino acid ABC transporter permease [Capsulimonadaceae bacterium]